MDEPQDNPAAQLAAVPEQEPSQAQTFVMVPPALLQEVIKQLSKQPAKKVYGLLTGLNQCRTVQTTPADG